MSNYLVSLGNAVVDRTPAELITAVIIALGLSLAFAGIDFIGQRKVRDAVMPMIVLMLVANLASMAIGAGYFAHMFRTRGSSWTDRRPPGLGGGDFARVETIFRAADKNRDGFLSSEEASVAAAEFVRKADPSGGGLISPSSLEQAIWPDGFRHHRSGRNRLPFGALPEPPSSRRNYPTPEAGPPRLDGPPPVAEKHDAAAATHATDLSSDSGTESIHSRD